MSILVANFKPDTFTLRTMTMSMYPVALLCPAVRVKISLTANVQNGQRQAFFPHNAEAIQEGTFGATTTSTTCGIQLMLNDATIYTEDIRLRQFSLQLWQDS
jgi:hypothetical protein